MAVEEIEKQSLKCRRCRFLVVEQPPHKILTGLESDDDQEPSNTFNICDENLPQWISAAIDEVRRVMDRLGTNSPLAGQLDQGQVVLSWLWCEAGRF